MTTSLVESPTIPWQLLECTPAGQPSRTVPIGKSPFSIGRLPDMSLPLASPSISKLHAEIVYQDGALWVRDLGSTNGTFVNERRVVDFTRLQHDDLLQLANDVFRVQRVTQDVNSRTLQCPAFVQVQALCQFDRLMSERAVVPHFQPITSLHTGGIVGYEILARSNLEGLKNPADMFAAAERLDQQVPLSMMLRLEGIRDGLQISGAPTLFVNTHPLEVVTPRFLASLTEVRALAPTQRIVIEIHEAAVTNPGAMRELHQHLQALDMQLAFDDFGAGQARLDELSEFPPDFVKFDIKLVRNLHEATLQRRHLVGRLVQLVRELGATPLAEGVELAAEADTCRALGFSLGQGYFFGRPQPRAALRPA